MTLNEQGCAQADILRDAALSGNQAAASFLCSAYADIINENSSIPASALPDLKGAVYAVASARPQGCNLTQGAAQACRVWELNCQ